MNRRISATSRGASFQLARFCLHRRPAVSPNDPFEQSRKLEARATQLARATRETCTRL